MVLGQYVKESQRFKTRPSGARACGGLDRGGPAGAVMGTTNPLRDRGDLPLLARPERCFAARRSPLRGKAGEPPASLSIHGPDREVYKSLRWTDLRGPRIKLGRTTRAASS